MASPPTDISRVLRRLARGEDGAADELAPLVYDELRRLAQAQFRRQPSGHTLQPTVLINEAFMRLVSQGTPEFSGRRHFYAAAATAMRNVLRMYARARTAAKRGGEYRQVSLDEPGIATPPLSVDILALDQALVRLEDRSPRQARVVVCRFFAGMTVDEVASVLDVSTTTVESEWRRARAWLQAQLASA